MKNPKLDEAVALFKELGWENAKPEEVLSLSLGTPHQKRGALAGLKSGDWGEIVKTSANTYNWQNYYDVDKGMLALFAMRVGVDARRAVGISYPSDKAALISVLVDRGAKYAADFIAHACVSRRRMHEHSASVHGAVAVILTDDLNLEIPQNVEYIKDWAVYAAAILRPSKKSAGGLLPSESAIRRRFVEHITTGIAVNAPAAGPFGTLISSGVERGWLQRDTAIELVFTALDSAVRPGDRKVWIGVLDELAVSDAELCARTQSLIPLLATGDTVVIERLAPLLIAQAEEKVLAEVLMASLSASTKKTQKLVLQAALKRQAPHEPEDLSPWLAPLMSSTNKTLASLAHKLSEKWGFAADAAVEEETALQQLWRETPAVWELPAFERGEASPQALTELAATMMNRAALAHDVLTERFLAVAVAVASKDAEAARVSLQGLRKGVAPLYDYLAYWVAQEQPRYGYDKDSSDVRASLAARDYQVCLHLAAVPCILSTPSSVDLSLTVPDLTDGLKRYQEAGVAALEADLSLALMRLDLSTNCPEATQALEECEVPIQLQSGEQPSTLAGALVLAYLQDPVQEVAYEPGKHNHWGKLEVEYPQSLKDLPCRLQKNQYNAEYYSVFPRWGDTALRDVKWNDEVYHEQGLILRQVAKRATPLPAGASMNMLAAQRSMTPDAAEDSLRAVTEAWERGLLRPGVARVEYLDWSSQAPSHLVTLAVALEGIAHDGLLSVVWPLLDALVEASLQAPRLLAGTAEIVELALALLPEVQYAVEQGLAGAEALLLPNIRVLAGRSGSSRAVQAAQSLVSQLPEAPEMSEEHKDSLSNAKADAALLMDPPFDELWPAPKEVPLPLDDGITMSIEITKLSASITPFLFTLTLPDISDRVFHVVKCGWHYDLDSEGQCDAYPVAPGTTEVELDRDKRVWLHWDTQQQKMVVSEKRNWAEGTDGPLSSAASPLSLSLLTIIVALLAQNGDSIYFATNKVNALIQKGLLGPETMNRIAQTLLANPAVSPAKLVRILEKDEQLLPNLWPLLTESLQHAGKIAEDGGKAPTWVNRVLDVSLRLAPYLKEAMRREYLPAEDAAWRGLDTLASLKAKSAAREKAQKLLEAFG